jgi:hypothetical protein
MNFNAILEWISILDLPRPGAACHLLMGDVGEAVVVSIFAKLPASSKVEAVPAELMCVCLKVIM